MGMFDSFYDETHSLRKDIALGIINSPEFDETPARKRALPMNFMAIKQRSSMINDICRQNHAGMEQGRGGSAPDERYLRIKANAESMLRSLQQKAA